MSFEILMLGEWCEILRCKIITSYLAGILLSCLSMLAERSVYHTLINCGYILKGTYDKWEKRGKPNISAWPVVEKLHSPQSVNNCMRHKLAHVKLRCLCNAKAFDKKCSSVNSNEAQITRSRI